MWRVVMSIVMALALTGCGPVFESEYTGPAEGDYGYGTPEELGAMLERRDAEQVIADRDRMLAEITTALTDIVPGSRWVADSEARTGTCGDFGSTHASIYFSPHFTSTVPIPAALWRQASAAVTDIAARYGYTNASGTAEASTGQASGLDILDGEGGKLSLLSMDAATVNVGTGCYLTAAQKQQARDAKPN